MEEIFPFSVALKAHEGWKAPEAPDRYTVDQAGRLESDDQKKAVARPQQTDRTAAADRSVLLGITRGSGSARDRDDR